MNFGRVLIVAYHSVLMLLCLIAAVFLFGWWMSKAIPAGLRSWTGTWTGFVMMLGMTGLWLLFEWAW